MQNTNLEYAQYLLSTFEDLNCKTSQVHRSILFRRNKNNPRSWYVILFCWNHFVL